MTKDTKGGVTPKPSKFKVENGVPMPTAQGSALSQYPFLDMMPGQSFLVPCAPGETKRTVGKLGYAMRKFGAENKCRFVTRVAEGGVRCWRYE